MRKSSDIWDVDNFLIILFAISAGLQILYTIFMELPTAMSKAKTENRQLPLSVILCARNEEENLLKNLETVLNQDYPTFEVIAVDDASTDNSLHVLKAFQKSHPQLKIVTVLENERYILSKKYALTLGIKAAQYEHLVLTDADCRPMSSEWLKCMSSFYVAGKNMVLGFGGYKRDRGVLNALIRLDTAQIALNYMGMARIGMPYMGVGRNLSYHRDLFFENKGFGAHQHLRSGDDDLFVSAVAKKGRVSIGLDLSASTQSEAKTTLKEWVLQKSRHLTTAPEYDLKTKSHLLLLHGSRYLFHLSFAMLMLLSLHWPIILGVYISWWILHASSLYLFGKRMKDNDLFLFSLLGEYLLLLLYPYFAWSSLGYKNLVWKN